MTEPVSPPTSESPEPSEPRTRDKLSPRRIRADAKLIMGEAKAILRKHRGRIDAARVAEIEASRANAQTHLEGQRWGELDEEIERLDELLHQHASFARKSALRETLENVSMAVLAALSLRACIYEPFKIPSGSMMPTLRDGDHIFVNKFTHGIQIPFTTTIAAKDMLGPIGRGEVVVFRYPLDESEDYIKRVIGLPGDSVRVEGDKVWIKRAGAEDFELLPRKRLDQACLDEASVAEVRNCELFEETLDGRTYVVRFDRNREPTLDRRTRTITVPEDRLLVMGDNRFVSHDSLAWMDSVEAVSADGILSPADLRELGEDEQFTLRHPPGAAQEDPSQDQVRYLADHRAPRRDLQLEVWRSPSLGWRSIYAAGLATTPDAKATDFAKIVHDSPTIEGAFKDRLFELGTHLRAYATAAVGKPDPKGHQEARIAFFALETENSVFRLRCGWESCADEGALAERVAEIIAGFEADSGQPVRELVEPDPGVRYDPQWRSPRGVEDRYAERRWSAPGPVPTPREQVRLRVWRRADEGVPVLEAAAWHSLGRPQGPSAEDPALELEGYSARAAELDDRFVLILPDLARESMAVLECGKARCEELSDLRRMAEELATQLPNAARDRRAFQSLLGQSLIGPWPETPVPAPERYEWERVRYQATVRGGNYQMDLAVRRADKEDLATLVERVRKADPELQESAYPIAGASFKNLKAPTAHLVFAVEQSKTLVEIRCAPGLCPDEASLMRYAERAAEKAKDPDNFIDPAALRPQPFVPRGNVKGRADRIWLPWPRFGLEIR